MYTLAQILIALPVGTATVQRSFSQMKQIKTRFSNRLLDQNLKYLMKIAIEGPELKDVNFLIDMFKATNRRIRL